MRAAWTRRTVLLVVAGMVGAALVALDATASSYLPAEQRFFLERVAPALRRGARWWHLAGVTGAVLLFAAWLGLRPERGRRPPLGVAAALWCLPLLCCPPVLTADPYAYAAQGWLLSIGRDPYAVPMGFYGPYADGVYAAWRPTTAVYPPFALLLQQLVVEATGAHAWWGVVGMRAISLTGLGLMAVAAILLARQHDRSARLAVWGAVLNPLSVLHLVGGAHNDSMMIGLIMLAVWAAGRRHGLVWGAALIGLATMFKQPAVLAGAGVVLVALPAHLRERPVRWAAIAARMALGAVVGGAVFLALSVASGLGLGWLSDTGGSPSLVINHTPLSWLAQAALRFGHVSPGVVDAVLTVVSSLLMLAGFAYVTRRFALSRPVLFTAGVLLVFGLLGSAVQPWYALWGGCLLPVAGITRRTERVVCAVLLAFLVSAPLGNPPLHVTLASGLAYAWWRRGQRPALPTGDPLPD